MTCCFHCNVGGPAAATQPEHIADAPKNDMASAPRVPESAEQHLISMENIKLARDVTVRRSFRSAVSIQGV